jgi:hypothetical protein
MNNKRKREELQLNEEKSETNLDKGVKFERKFDHVDGNWPSHLQIPISKQFEIL